MTTTNKMPAWEVVLNVVHPKLKRPRFFSLHTIATLIGHDDIKKLAQEMRDSGRVSTCHCPYVRTIVFYPKTYAYGPLGSYGDGEHWGNSVAKFVLEKYPYPQVRGFKYVKSYWTGGSYGKGQQINEETAMPVPFTPEDYAYANTIIDALITAGYKPGIEKYELANG